MLQFEVQHQLSGQSHNNNDLRMKVYIRHLGRLLHRGIATKLPLQQIVKQSACYRNDYNAIAVESRQEKCTPSQG